MTVKFAETPQATYNGQFWTSTVGSVTRDTTAARDPLGLSSWKCDTGAVNAAAYLRKNGILADAGRRLSAFFYLSNVNTVCFFSTQGYWDIALNNEGVLQFYGDGFYKYGSTLNINTLQRISVAYIITATNDFTFKIFVNGVLDMTVTQADGNVYTGATNLTVGFPVIYGANKVLNFSHVYVDGDTSLTDPVGPGYGLYVTAKLPAAVNDNAYTTTGGTGAVNERALSETNYMEETGKTAFLQDYTLQAAAVGDVDLTAAGITLIARDAWMWWKTSSTKNPGSQSLVDNGGLVACTETTTASLFNYFTDSATYPSNAAGIGQKSTGTVDDIYLYECGTLIVYKLLTAAGPTGVKTINDVLVASVKSVNDCLIASVKTINDAP